jgi:hypothetical protein
MILQEKADNEHIKREKAAIKEIERQYELDQNDLYFPYTHGDYVMKKR